MSIQPPHEAHDKSRLNSMIDTLKSGGKLPAILVYQDQAYSGSHRLAAWIEMDIEPDYVELSDEQYTLIMQSLDLDPGYDAVTDFEPFLDEAILLGFIA